MMRFEVAQKFFVTVILQKKRECFVLTVTKVYVITAKDTPGNFIKNNGRIGIRTTFNFVKNTQIYVRPDHFFLARLSEIDVL